jgi:hypothetical protein
MKKNIYFLPSNLNLSKLKDVSTPLQKRRNEFHLLNIWFMILLSKINLTLNLMNIKKDIFTKS